MSKINGVYKDSHLYYNVSIANNTSFPTTQAVYNENRLIPLIKKPEDYHMSIIRMQVPMDSLPLFNFSKDDSYIISMSVHDITANEDNFAEIPLQYSYDQTGTGTYGSNDYMPAILPEIETHLYL